ncbi:MAG: SMC-Scp complex subunit ScpB [Deltaproteobacteria bacterium]|nr:SMC-Scp complex subunit ScpB [Deltaproteobacteria bacterium]NIS78291.1 SMC-Scp complex subunit ScpB [Deltaproteobacteria bacterium]
MIKREGKNGPVRRLSSIIESMLLVSPTPLTEERARKVLPHYDKQSFDEAIMALQNKYSGESGILLERVAGGYQLRTNPANQDYVRALLESRPPRLSRASLETVSIIAYKQPITRAEIEDIRGVDSQGAIKTLMERRLIKVVGKKEVPGRPFLFGTTKEFLELFGLESLSVLPSISELEEILGSRGEDVAPGSAGDENEPGRVHEGDGESTD